MKKKPTLYRLYTFLLFAGIFMLGGLYSNCGSIDPDQNVRQKIFIDEIDQVPICKQDQDCKWVGGITVEAYELKTPDFAE